MKKSEEMHLKSTINESTLSTADAVPLPRVGKVASEASRIGVWRDEKERRRSSQVGDIDERGSVSSTPFAKAPYPPLRGPPSPMGKAKRRRLGRKKEANPASLRSAAPSKGRGSRGQLPPSYGRRCPEGAEVGWGSGMKESEEMYLKSTINESTLSTADAVPLPQWGRLRYGDTAFLALSEQIHAYVEKE